MKAQAKPFALCTDNTGFQASLIPGKVYRSAQLSQRKLERVIGLPKGSGPDPAFPLE